MKLAGKSEARVAAVFGFSPASCHQAVLYLRKGAPAVPVWLFATCQPLPETLCLCEKVVVHSSGLVLLHRAQRDLWHRWLALSVATWTGGHGKWILKLAPFLIPPFRALILNAHGDFLAGTPRGVACHALRIVRDACENGWHSLRSVAYTVAEHSRDFAYWFRAAVLLMRLILWSALRGFRSNFKSELSAGDDAVASFKQAGPRWRRQTFEDLVGTSTARFILWHEGTDSTSVADLMPLFDDPRTFAVSRQSCFRAWQPLILPAAPFRKLQPGEATQVFAPISNTILVDRQKLLALGVPRARLASTAWTWIFWKAASAGWRSFSVGQDNAVAEQAGPPNRQVGFLVGLMSGPLLRRFGPADLALSRGCVAFMPRRDWNGSRVTHA